ncbi:GTPase-activator protein for Ras-like GTPase containing protein [Colletotrichum tofieldiae]|uniref:GTPase-activator protein for Ras-like GTPase containing protein n=1 Tax=Colletotrichum tofieldiae TaxID=708197 RepID=A0A166WI05_9PEZI|nr:GTPase-activator protein for Ras-like GTPase containing protein [Colletotrichum tofieldiae]GKT55684.1 GTPase-activator protein for Ras-like GTPase containing protein [Colletotrichum tofieldiae]
MSTQTPEELLSAVEASHEQYLRSLRSLHESLASAVRERSEQRTASNTLSPSPRPSHSPYQSPVFSSEATFPPASRHDRRLTLSEPIEKRPLPNDAETKHVPASIHSELDVEYLPLLDITYFDFTGGAAIGLADVIKRQAEIDENADFEAFAAYESQGYVSSTFELYDVGKEGIPRPIVDAPTVWNALKGIHADGQAVGLVTILHEPSTLMLGACT